MSNDHKADIIVIGASAGGIEAMMTFVAELKPDFHAALFVTIHQPARESQPIAGSPKPPWTSAC